MMEESDDVLEHINELKPVEEQHEVVGALVRKDDLMVTLLDSLSESYQFLITELESHTDSLLWHLVTSRVMTEYMKRKKQGGIVDRAADGQG